MVHCINKNLTAACCVTWYSRVAELTEQLERADKEILVEKDALLDHVDQLTTESTVSKLENESLKVNTQQSTKHWNWELQFLCIC